MKEGFQVIEVVGRVAQLAPAYHTLVKLRARSGCVVVISNRTVSARTSVAILETLVHNHVCH